MQGSVEKWEISLQHPTSLRGSMRVNWEWSFLSVGQAIWPSTRIGLASRRSGHEQGRLLSRNWGLGWGSAAGSTGTVVVALLALPTNNKGGLGLSHHQYHGDRKLPLDWRAQMHGLLSLGRGPYYIRGLSYWSFCCYGKSQMSMGLWWVVHWREDSKDLLPGMGNPTIRKNKAQ
jgi:hypothetical protein